MTYQKPLVVLLHGAWMGGFCWYSLIPHLAEAGWPVLAPTFAGCAGKYNPVKAGDVSLSGHVSDTLRMIKLSGAQEVVLVGHSYGALVAVEVASKLGNRVRKLCLLDGFICEQGKSAITQYPVLEEMFAGLVPEDRPGLLEVPPREFLGLAPGIEADWLRGHCRPMPLGPFQDVVSVSAGELTCDKHFINFSGFGFFSATADAAEKLGWQVRHIAAGHMAMVTDAELLSDALLKSLGP